MTSGEDRCERRERLGEQIVTLNSKGGTAVELPTDLGHHGVNLLHAESDDAGQEGLESLARLLHHHLQDFQELLHHPTSRAALLQDAGCQLLPAVEEMQQGTRVSVCLPRPAARHCGGAL